MISGKEKAKKIKEKRLAKMKQEANQISCQEEEVCKKSHKQQVFKSFGPVRKT